MHESYNSLYYREFSEVNERTVLVHFGINNKLFFMKKLLFVISILLFLNAQISINPL